MYICTYMYICIYMCIRIEIERHFCQKCALFMHFLIKMHIFDHIAGKMSQITCNSPKICTFAQKVLKSIISTIFPAAFRHNY